MTDEQTNEPTSPDKKPTRKRRKTRAKRAYRKREKPPKDALPDTFPERILAACGMEPCASSEGPLPPELSIEPPIIPTAPAYPRFDYRRVNLSTNADALLAELGDEGWEMVGVLGEWWGVFRRRRG